MTSVMEWCGWSTPHFSHFTPGKDTQYLLYMTLDGPCSQSGQVLKILLPPGFELRSVQPVAAALYLEGTQFKSLLGHQLH